jgi:hypothetical protein
MIFFKSGPFDSNNLEDVMVGMPTFSSMDRGFDHQLGQTKNYKLIFSNSLLSMQQGMLTITSSSLLLSKGPLLKKIIPVKFDFGPVVSEVEF